MPEIPIKFLKVVDDLMQRHASGSRISVRKSLTGGHTDACVLLVDILSGSTVPTISGEYVLKLDTHRNWNNGEPNRKDRYWAQQLLARVAVGLNWCNKPLSPTSRHLALAYGAWNARDYLRRFHEQEWHELLRGSSSEFNVSNELKQIETTTAPPDQGDWNIIWDCMSKFDSGHAKFVLLSDRAASSSDLVSLGMLPWSAIIDIDPESDINGFYSVAGPILSRARSLQHFGREALPVDFERGTAWLMAGGWPRGLVVETPISQPVSSNDRSYEYSRSPACYRR